MRGYCQSSIITRLLQTNSHIEKIPQIPVSNYRRMRQAHYIMDDRHEFTALPRVSTSECLTLNTVSKSNGWQTDYRQLSGGSFYAWSDLSTCASLLLSDRYCNREMTISGIAPPDHVALFLPQNPVDKGIFQGKLLRANDAALLSPSSEAFYRTPANVRMMVVTIPITRLRRSMTAVTHDDAFCLTGATRVITLVDNSLANLSSQIKNTLQAAQSSSTDTGFTVCLQELEQHFVGTLALALGGGRASLNMVREHAGTACVICSELVIISRQTWIRP